MQQPAADLREELIRGVLAADRHASRRLHWSSVVMDDLVLWAPQVAFPILLELIERAPFEALGLISAGPLENLINEHGLQFIDAIEAEAKRSPKLRTALVGVWQGLTVEPVWNRIQALIDESDRAEWQAFELRDHERRLEWQVSDRPPSMPGSTEQEQQRRRNALLWELREMLPRDFEVWRTPVFLDIRVESGPTGESTASAGDVAAAIAETLAVDRPPSLTNVEFDGFGVYASRNLVRETSSFDVFSHEPSYRVLARVMGEDQVAALSDPATFDERAEPQSLDDLREHIKASFLESGLEITDEMRQQFRNQGIEFPSEGEPGRAEEGPA